VVDSIVKARELFPNGLAILSNSAGSCDDDDFVMAKKTEESIGIPVIRHEIKKPGCLDEVIDHFAKKSNLIVKPNEICVIGDRLMTDVIFANQNQMISILVDPLSNTRDHPVAMIFRSVPFHFHPFSRQRYFVSNRFSSCNRLLELKLVIPFVYFMLWLQKRWK
jgi:HAD superfamily phosphatase (TIGR01668 family)